MHQGFDYWSLIGVIIIGLLAVVAAATIAAGAFNVVLWAIVITPTAALAYAYRRAD